MSTTHHTSMHNPTQMYLEIIHANRLNPAFPVLYFMDEGHEIKVFPSNEQCQELRNQLLAVFPLTEPVTEIPVGVPVHLRLTSQERTNLKEALARADREEAGEGNVEAGAKEHAAL